MANVFSNIDTEVGEALHEDPASRARNANFKLELQKLQDLVGSTFQWLNVLGVMKGIADNNVSQDLLSLGKAISRACTYLSNTGQSLRSTSQSANENPDVAKAQREDLRRAVCEYLPPLRLDDFVGERNFLDALQQHKQSVDALLRENRSETLRVAGEDASKKVKQVNDECVALREQIKKEQTRAEAADKAQLSSIESHAKRAQAIDQELAELRKEKGELRKQYDELVSHQQHENQAQNQAIEKLRQSNEHFGKALEDIRVKAEELAQQAAVEKIAQWDEAWREFQQGAEAQRSTLSEANRKSQEILAAMEEASGKAGIARYSGFFNDAAKNYRTYARYSLLTASISLGLMVLWVVIGTAVLWPESTDTSALIVYRISTKVLGLAVLSAVLAVAIRSYLKCMHNSVINEHRHLALASFMSFVQAAGHDEQTKNALLLQATQAVYSHQDTGFGSAHGHEGESAAQVIDLLKTTVTRSAVGGSSQP